MVEVIPQYHRTTKNDRPTLRLANFMLAISSGPARNSVNTIKGRLTIDANSRKMLIRSSKHLARALNVCYQLQDDPPAHLRTSKGFLLIFSGDMRTIGSFRRVEGLVQGEHGVEMLFESTHMLSNTHLLRWV